MADVRAIADLLVQAGRVSHPEDWVDALKRMKALDKFDNLM